MVISFLICINLVFFFVWKGVRENADDRFASDRVKHQKENGKCQMDGIRPVWHFLIFMDLRV